MEMTRGLGLGILLICFLQAELSGCSWAKEAPRLQSSNFRSSYSLPDDKLKTFSSAFQNQVRMGSSSPRSVQARTFNTNPAVNTRSLAQTRSQPAQPRTLIQTRSQPSQTRTLAQPRTLAQTSSQPAQPRTLIQTHSQPAQPRTMTQTSSQPVQGSGRLVKNSPRSKPGSQSTLSAQERERKGHRDSYSFRAPPAASLFGPVGPGPRSSVRMQTYAQGPARKVSSVGTKVRGIHPRTAAGRSSLTPTFALNVGGQRVSGLAGPRSSREGESVPGYAPVTLHEIPEAFGGSAIRRLRPPTAQGAEPVQMPQQVHAAPQPYKVQPGSDWTRTKQNQGPVQKPRQIPTPPPRWAPADPNLPGIHPASRWSQVKRPYRL